MRYYTKILPHENRRRLAATKAFRDEVAEYFDNCEYEDFEAIENERARHLRTTLNTKLAEIRDMVRAAGVGTFYVYSPPPIMGGGPRGNIDVIDNLFCLVRFEIPSNVVTDTLERAYGIYDRNRKAARWRLVNPFFYLGWLLDLVAEIPFAILGAIGLDRGKAEASPLGKAAKVIFRLVAFLAALATLLHYLGLMDGIRKALFG